LVGLGVGPDKFRIQMLQH